jgi:hypothetical protein
MKIRYSAIFITALLVATSAFPSELLLFNLPLKSAARDQLIGQAKENGARHLSEVGQVDLFDASGMGLPGLKSLTVVFYDKKFVLARYSSLGATEKNSFGSRISASDEEKLRKMLAVKYGKPTPSPEVLLNPYKPSFTEQYISAGKYYWAFDSGMKITFDKQFGGNVDVTYFNPQLVEVFKAASEAANDRKLPSAGGKL